MLHGPEPPDLTLVTEIAFGEIALSLERYRSRVEGVDPDDVQMSRSLEDLDLILQGCTRAQMLFIEVTVGEPQDIENYLFLLIGGLREPGFNEIVLV